MAVWQDREIRFDSPIEQLKIMHGEVIIDCDVKEKNKLPMLTVRARSGRKSE